MVCSGFWGASPISREHPIVQTPFPPIPSNTLEGEDQTFYVKSRLFIRHFDREEQETQQEYALCLHWP